MNISIIHYCAVLLNRTLPGKYIMLLVSFCTVSRSYAKGSAGSRSRVTYARIPIYGNTYCTNAFVLPVYGLLRLQPAFVRGANNYDRPRSSFLHRPRHSVSCVRLMHPVIALTGWSSYGKELVIYLIFSKQCRLVSLLLPLA